jgi:hypothetical protein
MIASIQTNQTELIKNYGCNKYQLGDKMRNNFHIPDEYLGALETYRVIHISGAQFTRAMWDGTVVGVPDIENTYDVIYHLCTPFKAKRAVEIRISFRKAREEFNLPAIALVEIVQEIN